MVEYTEKEALIASFEEDIAAAESHPRSHFSRDGIAYLKYAVSKVRSAPAANVREIEPIRSKGDQLRAMSDEELAKEFERGCPPGKDYISGNCVTSRDCYPCFLNWLKSPEVEV